MATERATTPQSAATAAEASIVPRGNWRVVSERSNVGFRVRKMGMYYVKGRFGEVEGRVEFGPHADAPSGEVVIGAASINTRMPPRDLHLRSRDFLDVKQHPEIRLRAERIEQAGDGRYRVPAEVEIHGERRPVELTAHVHDPDDSGPDPDAVRLHLEGTLNRHDFGIRATPPAEWVVAEDIDLDVELLLELAG